MNFSKSKILYTIIFTIGLFAKINAQAPAKAPVIISKQQLVNYIESLKNDDDLKNALWSVMVVDCATQKTIAAHQASTNLVPASILKLITTGAGMLTFGGKYSFSTALAYSGKIDADSTLQGNLYLIGGGDPTFGSSQFSKMNVDSVFRQLKDSIISAGIRSINGKLIADASLFDDNEIQDTWEWGDIGNYYGSGTSALSFCENAFSITIKPGKATDSLVKIGTPYPTLPNAIIKNKATTTPKDSSIDALIYSSPMQQEYWISGTLPLSKDSVVAKGAIQNPPKACIANFDDFLNRNGINTSHTYDIKTEVSNDSITVIAKIYSPTYQEIAANTNRHSNNVFAEMILKNIAARKQPSKRASYESGVNEILKLLKNKNIDTKNIRIADGSGLSRQNLISADFMCRFLSMMYKVYPNFEQLLPAPGEKGTLNGFMKDYPNGKNVHLKSGSMTGILNYAGYVKNKKGNTLCITVMTNNFTCKVAQIRPKLEKLVYLITESE